MASYQSRGSKFSPVKHNDDTTHNETLIENAKQTEQDKMRQFNTFDEIEDHGQNTISTRWVITGKENN